MNRSCFGMQVGGYKGVVVRVEDGWTLKKHLMKHFTVCVYG